jgi:uncharacterized protein (DUF1499 family)
MSLLPLIAGGLLALAAVAAWVRLAPSDPRHWQVDPAAVTDRHPENSYLVADVPGADAPALRLAVPPAEAGARLAAIALASPRTRRLAGDDGFAVYISRSALWGFPDYTSVRVAAEGAASKVSVFARARFGKGDLGVNRARVSRWLSDLSAAAGAARR